MIARGSRSVWTLIALATSLLSNLGSSAQDSDSKPKTRSVTPVEIKPERRTLSPGTPLSVRTLVLRPPQIPSVLSWTIESKRHRGYLVATALSPDAKQLATGGLDGIIRIWDAETGEFQKAFVGHDSYIYDLAWSPDGRTLASGGSWDATARLWDVRSGLNLRSLKHPGYVGKVAWSPDGRMLVVCGGESGICLFWDVTIGAERGKVEHGRHVLSCAWSPDGASVVFTCSGQATQVFDTEEFKTRKSLGDAALTETNYSAAWSLDNKLLAVATNVGTKIFDAKSGDLKQTLAGPMTTVAWSPDGKVLATAYSGNPVQTWNTADWKLIKALPIGASALAYSNDGSRLSLMTSSTVTLWDVAADKALPTIDASGPASRAMWTTGKFMASGIGTNVVSVWDIATGKLAKKLEGHTAPITAIAWAPNNKTLASASADKTVQVWDAQKGELLKKLEGHTAGVAVLSWAPNGKQLASGSHDKSVRLWDTVTGKSTKTLDDHPAAVTLMDWNGKMLVAGGPSNTIFVWNTTTGQTVRKLEVSGQAQSLSWSPDGKVIATGGVDDAIRIMNPANGSTHAKLSLPGEPPSVTALAWSAKGETIASGRANHTAQIWDPQTGKVAHNVATMAPVQEVMWSDTLRTLAVGTTDRCVRFFDTKSGKLRATLITDHDQVPAITADGHYRADSEPKLVYVVQTESSQDTLSPTDFAKKYRWKNSPKDVKLAD